MREGRGKGRVIIVMMLSLSYKTVAIILASRCDSDEAK